MELQARRKARTHLLDMVAYLRRDYRFNWHHVVLAAKLTAFALGLIKHLMILMPPGHSKSEFVSRFLPGFIFGLNPDLRIMACSYGSDLAKDMSRDAQRIIDSSEYRNVFPHVALARSVRSEEGDKRTQSAFNIVGHRGVYGAYGVGGGIAGRRFDRGIIDDPVRGRIDADSPTIRDKIWKWYTNDFLPRRWKDAGIVIVATRWHRDDLCGQLLNHERDKWTVIEFPAISIEERHPLDERTGPGQALWPAFQDVEALEEIRETDRRAFSALYQQNPTLEGGQEWPDDCFGPEIWVDEWPEERPQLVLVAMDASKGKQSRRHDYSAFVAVGVTEHLIYVVADLDKRNPTRIVEDFFTFCERYRPGMVGLEAEQFQELFVGLLQGAAKEREGWYLTNYLARGDRIIELLQKGLSKEFRIRRLSQYITKRQFRFVRSPGTALLVDQLRDFPLVEHDDGPDALEMAIRLPYEAGDMDAGVETVVGRIGG